MIAVTKLPEICHQVRYNEDHRGIHLRRSRQPTVMSVITPRARQQRGKSRRSLCHDVAFLFIFLLRDPVSVLYLLCQKEIGLDWNCCALLCQSRWVVLHQATSSWSCHVAFRSTILHICHDNYDTAQLAVIKIAKALLASTANCSCS